ncbi:hypothetical protein H310_04352 [Aphanomyces invadans]|uniref:Uncharacterized protein n=1 Tax=Aphanomyces invadans TaxID=157072 RepID=A0A024UC20_9STRA|nr:hypothetical protein H310_04352 [Aphanomyces invadans]ETW03936.1 hypothetical protein H310_04352 [Aphanomyces invadans]|eukprot:XP_008866892.1 hypothetical protein H310_04352 [Aphanomyces invadans]
MALLPCDSRLREFSQADTSDPITVALLNGVAGTQVGWCFRFRRVVLHRSKGSPRICPRFRALGRLPRQSRLSRSCERAAVAFVGVCRGDRGGRYQQKADSTQHL